MTLFIEILLIVLIYLAGMGLGLFIPVPFSLLSMGLFFLLLMTGLLKDRLFTKISTLILSNLAFFFIPPAVEIVDSMSVLEGNYLKLIVIMVVSNICVLAVTALVVQAVLNRKENNRD